MQLKPGMRFRSQVCQTEVVVVKAAQDGLLTCGGVPVVPLDRSVDPDAVLSLGHSGGTLLGKRYTDDSNGVEILCVKAGEGSLGLDGEQLTIKTAKALPSSD